MRWPLVYWATRFSPSLKRCKSTYLLRLIGQEMVSPPKTTLRPKLTELRFTLFEKRRHRLELVGLVYDLCLLYRLGHQQIGIRGLSHHI